LLLSSANEIGRAPFNWLIDLFRMRPDNLEYPLLIASGTEVPPDGPPPYSGNNEAGDLTFFQEEATDEEWGRYHVWLQEQAEWRRDSDEDVAIISGEVITTRDVDTLKKSEWIRDNILHYAFKTLNTPLGETDPLVAFFPSFFFTKLYQDGHEDPNRSDTYNYAGVATWTKKFLRGTPIDEMKTIVFLYNEGCMHWNCFVIFMDLKIIQAFDSMGHGGAEHIKNLYRWLHATMTIAGKSMNPAEWRLYSTRSDTPRQSDQDCGLYAVMFGMCAAKRLPLSVITKQRIKAARVLLLLHLIDLQPERARPLGEKGQYKPKRPNPSLNEECLSPDTPSKEMDGGKGGLVLDLMTPSPKMEATTHQSDDSVLDLITPTKNPKKETTETATDLVIPPTKRKLNLSEEVAGNEAEDDQKTKKDDGGASEVGKNEKGVKNESGSGNKDDLNDVNDDLATISGIILPFVDYTGVAKKNHELYTKAVEVNLKKDSKASRSNLKKRKANFQKAWVTYQQRLSNYIDKKEKHEDEGVCVACAEMADKKVACIMCSVCVHPVSPCSHTSVEKDLLCVRCYKSLPVKFNPKNQARGYS
jgi:hypothetical protein